MVFKTEHVASLTVEVRLRVRVIRRLQHDFDKELFEILLRHNWYLCKDVVINPSENAISYSHVS